MKARSLLFLAAPVLITTFLITTVLTAASAARADDGCEGAAAPGRARLTVENTDLRLAQGEVQTTVYPDDPRRFLARRGKVARARAPAVLPVTRSCFWLPPGTYAVAVYHDQNNNHAFDRNSLGLPTEGFGFSNDAPAHFGLPAFGAVRFTLPPGGRTIRVKMRYQTKPG
jgi:uncharacterized protein (DUF2141 family)